ncbi:hypothetical protein EA187_15515 [Lujinxingia sediminis]|uniref:Uncharacterized protein n=1 Tax=Lujinxingia sediminis TaxID=2480984 RepID=A0ABY0CQ28_9DELT|nr:hypothetical protein [Lujinxingia sediminis]RVU42594.1 hypothetical protein EA187_15515 [Lujinxingia sediminis]
MKLNNVLVACLAVTTIGCFSGPSMGESAEATEVEPSSETAQDSRELAMEIRAEVPLVEEGSPSADSAGDEGNTNPELEAEAAFRQVTWAKMQERVEAFKACAGEDYDTTNAYFEAVATRAADSFNLGSLNGEESESELGRCVHARMRDVLGEVQSEAPAHVHRLGFSVWVLGPDVKLASCSGDRVLCEGMEGVAMNATLSNLTIADDASCPHSDAIIAGGEEVFQDAIACHTMGQELANEGGDAMPLGAQAWVAVRYSPELDQHYLYARYTDAAYEPVARCLIDAHKALVLQGQGESTCQQNLCSRLYSFATHPVLSLMVH